MMKSSTSALPVPSSLFDPLGVIGFSSIEAPLLAALATDRRIHNCCVNDRHRNVHAHPGNRGAA